MRGVYESHATPQSATRCRNGEKLTSTVFWARTFASYPTWVAHFYFATLLVGVIILHVLAAFHHQFPGLGARGGLNWFRQRRVGRQPKTDEDGERLNRDSEITLHPAHSTIELVETLGGRRLLPLGGFRRQDEAMPASAIIDRD